MRKLLIASCHEQLTKNTCMLLQDQYEIRVCDDGNEAMELLKTFNPDALILSFSLSGKDGIALLQDAAAYLPPVIIGLSTYTSSYVEQTVAALGVSYMIMLPCLTRCVTQHLEELMEGKVRLITQGDARKHLQTMGFNKSLHGYRQLLAAISLYEQNPDQSMTKELYPAVAKQCGNDNGNQIERSIRNAIHNAWSRRNESLWEQYFPGFTDCPSNKVFISQLIERIYQGGI